jgi:hypothetical protein
MPLQAIVLQEAAEFIRREADSDDALFGIGYLL